VEILPRHFFIRKENIMLQEKKQGMQLWHGLPLLEVEHKGDIW